MLCETLWPSLRLGGLPALLLPVVRGLVAGGPGGNGVWGQDLGGGGQGIRLG